MLGPTAACQVTSVSTAESAGKYFRTQSSCLACALRDASWANSSRTTQQMAAQFRGGALIWEGLLRLWSTPSSNTLFQSTPHDGSRSSGRRHDSGRHDSRSHQFAVADILVLKSGELATIRETKDQARYVALVEKGIEALEPAELQELPALKARVVKQRENNIFDGLAVRMTQRSLHQARCLSQGETSAAAAMSIAEETMENVTAVVGITDTVAGITAGCDGQSFSVILVSGASGSGTTMVTKVLCEAEDTICFPNNSYVSEFSRATQVVYRKLTNGKTVNKADSRSRHCASGQDTTEIAGCVQFHNANAKLWNDPTGRLYVEQSLDRRNVNVTEVLLREMAASLFSLHNNTLPSARRFIFHQSIPFSDNAHWPFLGDLPQLESLLNSDFMGRHGMSWRVHALIVLRDRPSAWNSKGMFETAPAFHISSFLQRLLSQRKKLSWVQFLQYEWVLQDPAAALSCFRGPPLCIRNQAQLLRAPDVAGPRSPVRKKPTNYVSKLKALTREWSEYAERFSLLNKAILSRRCFDAPIVGVPL